MAQGAELDLKDIVLSNSSFGPREIDELTSAITEDFSRLSTLRDAVAELEIREDRTPASAVRLGVCYFLLGRYERARETLENSDGSALALYYLARTHAARDDHQTAKTNYQSAKKAGYNSDDCELAIAECERLEGNSAQALEVLDGLSGAVEQTQEYLYQRGATVAALGGNPTEVVALYQRAVDSSDHTHAGALFGLALENDRRGNDQFAIGLYERAATCFPTHVGVLLNLGILYEDRQSYDRAQQCYQRILDAFPNEPRAVMYRKDAIASNDMYYDEEAARRSDRLSQVLNVPVSDFELSVRSRNCLKSMGVETLGDLTRTSEQELLASKNFGETSLIEIREMLTSKGLDLGQFSHESAEHETPIDTSNMSPDEQALMDRPISDLNLSVRARKCMVRLGINTIGELIRKTGDDLLESKNFGVTSLNEVRDKLGQIGLKLRGD